MRGGSASENGRWRGGRRTPAALAARAALAALILVAGCSADEPLNPSFPLRLEDAKEAMREMREAPKPLARPVVVLAGIHDPGLVAGKVERRLREVTGYDGEVISVTFFTADTFDDCRQRIIEAVDEAYPTDDPEATTEVDVVAISMGGLVARHAIRPHGAASRRLRARRLFTIATPHRGARMAGVPTLDERILDMRSGSEFLESLDAEERPEDPVVYPYTRLDDAVVGPDRTAPPGREPWWVANIPLSLAHVQAPHDARILADIARRLRGETPYTLDPPAPLPEASGTVAAP